MASFLILSSFMVLFSGFNIYYYTDRDSESTPNFAPFYLPTAIILFGVCEVYFRMKRDIDGLEIELKKEFEG